jgi:carboxypeptidase Taq
LSSGSEKYGRLEELLAEVVGLRRAASLLHWDQQTMMPKAGAAARGNHMAVLGKVAHEKFTSPEVGKLLEDLRAHEASLPYDSDEAGAIRVARRGYEKATRLPPDLVVRLSRASTEGFATWLQAREAKDYKVFLPALERIYGLMREVTDVIGWRDHPLDALLDNFEPGMKIAEIEGVFDELRATLVPLCKAIFARTGAVDDGPTRLRYPCEPQMTASREAARAIGFDLETRGRLDLSVHPFTTSFSPDDARITTKVDEDFLVTSLFASLHEAGHGLYEQGLPTRFQQSVLGDGASAGLHESQSLLWENVVGRSRGFWEFFLPRLRAIFPAQLGGVSTESFYRAVNKVQPSFIRVDADEVTYNLHVMIRFELEKAVFDGELSLKDLAEAWRAKFRDYLGITPPDDLVGVLQDIHWTGGFGACFASYTVGHVSCLQLYEEAVREIPDLEAGFARGEFAPLREWMGRKVHAHGHKYGPRELVERATGRPLTTGPYLGYIKRKFGEIYGL